ncbi:hypothetical protein V8B97DRAFT_2026515 [Scleroderma yunnanense]
MVRQKSSLNKKPLIPESPSKRKTSSSENSSLEAIHHIKEVGKQAHLQAEKMQKAYDEHICQGCKWLQSHTDIYNDPRFKDAFENIPNHYSDKALALYLWSTVEDVHAAFKKLDGDTYHKKWHYNEAWQCWKENPATSAEVDDVMASIKHKVSAEGCDCVHSSAMKKEYMDKILTWSMTTCPELESMLHFISLVLTRSASASSLHSISDDMKMHITQYGNHLQIHHSLLNHSGALSLNWKGWQKKVDKGFREIDLQNLMSCDSFFWLVVWVRWVEHVQLGWAMVDGDYIFPAIEANGVLKLCKPLSQDAIQKWISEATTGTGIEGTFTTHCFCQGEAQYWFMYAPIGQQWPLSTHDMLICYLLDELHSYEDDHSDALGPFPHEADMSLAGEHAFATPATREELWMFQLSVSTEIHKLDNNIQAILRNNFTACSSAPLVILALGTNHTSPCYMFPQPPAISPSLVTMESDTLTYSLPSPFIPNIPFTHVDGTITPRNKAWRDVIQHWEKGVLEKRLPLLRDWLYEYTHGPNHNLQSKYNQYKGDEKKFKGITSLLHAITAAHQQRGEAEI